MDALLNCQSDLCSRIFKARTNFKKSPKERITKHYVESRLESIEHLWSEFRQGHKELVRSSDRTVLKAHIYTTNETYDKTEEDYTDYVCELKEYLDKFSNPKASQSKSNDDGTHDHSSLIKLPKISIPSFSGKYHEWTTFKDLFTSMIHNNNSLDDVQKMQYLKSYLTGEAEQLLRNIPVSDKNYTQCWIQLEQRYNNKKYLSHCILKRFLSQRSAANESAEFLKDLMDTSQDCLSALTNLGINVSTWDILVIHLLTLKLDPESRRQWELNVASSSASDELPTFAQFKEFLTSRYRALEFIEPRYSRAPNAYVKPASSSGFSKPNVLHVSDAPTMACEFCTGSSSGFSKPNVLHATDAPTMACEFCTGPHKLCFCKEFASESYVKRQEFVTNNRICYNCLGSNHSVRFCQKATSCRICKRRHHSLLHPKDVSTSTAYMKNEGQAVEGVSGEATHHVRTDSSPPEITPIVSCFTKGVVKEEILLATALVKAESKTGDYHVIRALLDQGSQASFVTEAVVQDLGIKKIPIQGTISGLGGDQTSVRSRYMVNLKVQSLTDPTFQIVLKAYVLNKITTYLPGKTVAVPQWVELQKLTLADPKYHTPNKIDVLLGAEVYCQVLREGMMRGPKGSPVAQCTTLGWILSGPIGSGSANESVTVLHAQVNEDEIIKRFWEMESEPLLTQKRILSVEEQRCEDIFAATTQRDETGRYVVKLPFRDEDPLCKGRNSREIAIKRFKSLERRLDKNKEFKERYTAVIREYMQLDHMIRVPDAEKSKDNSVYLPHHAVVREDKSTSKVRVVFDASCRNERGTSLNDTLMIGPTLQSELRHLIMQWRKYPICLIADIVKMYRMVRVSDADADYQRIIWRDSQDEEIQDYKLLTVTFGTASAPYLAVKALNQVAVDHMDEYPAAARRVAQGFYMDDLMTGGETVDEGIEVYKEMKALLQRGGFILQKWASNSKELEDYIDKNEVGEENVKREEKRVEIKLDNIVKILGLTWNKTKDEFQYSVKLPPVSAPVTKRKIISDVGRLFDPLGWIAPCVIKAKTFIQRLWIAGTGWDEEPSRDILKDWYTYREELSQLTGFTIPRWLNTNVDDEVVELHGFSDASNLAFAASVYLRIISASGDVKVQLIAAKTKVAPVKQVSIPRLELCGAVLLAKLLTEVSQVLNIAKENLRAWTDSMVVLAWLNKHPSNWKTFVANRVSEILSLLEPSQWFHVSTKENPADCASRGVSPAELINNSLWKTGPQFLKNSSITYKRPNNNETQVDKSIKAHCGIAEECVLNKYSSLSKLVRVIAYCRRFLRVKDMEVVIRSKHISPSEYNEALTTCIKMAQRNDFGSELSEITEHGCVKSKSSKVLSLTPFLDAKGVLRVGGRLAQSNETENIKHPILLPHTSPLSRLLVADAHQKTLHGAEQLMLNYLREVCYIVGVKHLVKHCVSKCMPCVRNKAAVQRQLMGSLPPARTTPTKAFLRSGVDYAGPIQLRTSKGRGHKSYKGYICLFVCMVTRAVHIDVVSEMTSRGFLETFKRFTARRGHCSDLYSDNGTNFVGAAKELREMLQSERSTMVQEIAEGLASKGTTWHFIPPRAPNFGGLWEAAIKSTKFHIKRVIGEATLTFEEMSTLLSQIEACLNSRPISVLPNNPNEPNPLTPGHFLVGEPLVTIPEVNYEKSTIGSLRRWQLTQRMLQGFWRRWSNEYLVNLLHRYKWAYKTPEPEVGDIVLVKEDDLPPTKWLFGRIIQKYPGTDSLTRVVSLKCGNSIIKRPTSKLCLLPVTS
jgi:hypothetical protein